MTFFLFQSFFFLLVIHHLVRSTGRVRHIRWESNYRQKLLAFAVTYLPHCSWRPRICIDYPRRWWSGGINGESSRQSRSSHAWWCCCNCAYRCQRARFTANRLCNISYTALGFWIIFVWGRKSCGVGDESRPIMCRGNIWVGERCIFNVQWITFRQQMTCLDHESQMWPRE